MHDHDCGYRKSREASRAERQAKRAAWRARWAARRVSRGDWTHFKDPKFWGLDAESMNQWGMGFGESNDTGEVARLQAKVAEMEKAIDAMNQRIIVLEKLIVDDEARIAREIDRLRDKPDGDRQ
ncbi:MAG: hypothetical protein R3C46_02210 [Hyphomonadaceae bacterium]